jgi:hypothetical protein
MKNLDQYQLAELEELLWSYMNTRGSDAADTLQSLDYAALGTREATLGGIIEGELEHQAVRAILERIIVEDLAPAAVEALEDEAGAAGDSAMVATCRRWFESPTGSRPWVQAGLEIVAALDASRG